jgi:uncharacterized protein YuzE
LWRKAVKITYDPEVDATYIYFTEKEPLEVTTIRLAEDVAVDLGPGEEIVGIEILDASRHLELSKTEPKVRLENLQLA